MTFFKELWDFLKVRKKWWLAPIVVLALIILAMFIWGGSNPDFFVN